MIRKAMLSAILFAPFLTTPAPAEEPAAAPSAWPRLVTVETRIDYRDLDLGSPAGAAEARRRVARAVRELCRPDATPAGQGRGRVDGHCVRQAMASARLQLEQAIAARNANVRTALNVTPGGVIEE